MNLPFPTAFLRGLSELERKHALEVWKELNQSATNNPVEYREKISSMLKEAVETEKEPSKSFIHHSYTLSTNIPPGNIVYVNVLTSNGIKPIKGTEIPLILSRERIVKKHHQQQRIYDIIVHPSTTEKSKKDSAFCTELKELFFDVISTEYKINLSNAGCVSKNPEYVGTWLWKKDGSQKNDFEMTTLNDLTPTTLLQQLQHDSDKCTSLQDGLEKLDLNGEEKQKKSSRSDSKLLIQELQSETSVVNTNRIFNSQSNIPNGSTEILSTSTDIISDKRLHRQVADYISNTKSSVTVTFSLQFLVSEFDYQPEKLKQHQLLVLFPVKEAEKHFFLYFRFYACKAEMIATPEKVPTILDEEIWIVHDSVIIPGDFKIKYSKKSKRLLITVHH